MRKRAEQVEETRQRIVEAAVRLHTSIGPSRTTISGLADEAGVTRVTVYRHFSDEDELYLACTAHWMAQHPPPDPSTWSTIADLGERVTVALTELYGWYGRNADDLYPIVRDHSAMPESAQRAAEQSEAAMADALVLGTKRRGRSRAKLRALSGHVVSFWTWRSLVVDQGLRQEEAIEVAARLLTCLES